MIPLETGGICPSTYTYVQCLYYGGVFKPGADIQIDLDRFNELLIAILFDLRNRAPVAGYDFDTRRLYDTPLWDMFEGGDACFGDACYARHEVNYVAQGMYVAASDQELAEGVAGVFAWKACNFVGCLPEVRPYRGHYPSFVPSGASLYWLSVGYNIFNTLQSSYPR
jgi:hypothetical protein